MLYAFDKDNEIPELVKTPKIELLRKPLFKLDLTKDELIAVDRFLKFDKKDLDSIKDIIINKRLEK